MGNKQSSLSLPYRRCNANLIFFIFDRFRIRISDEVLECVAGWKEGSSRYLIGRIRPLLDYHSSKLGNQEIPQGNNFFRLASSKSHTLGTSIQTLNSQRAQEPQYQCFRYELHQDENNEIVTKMSQSKKGSCQGLWSAIEGDRTYTLKKGKSYQNLLYHEETHN